MILFNKKFIAGLILLLVCFLVFFPVFSSISQAQYDPSDPSQNPGYPPGIGPNQSESVQNSGSNNSDKVSGLPGTIVLAATVIMNILGSFCGWIISVEAGILNWILNPENIRLATAPIVVIGWDVTRTTVNMFFVLVLLVVAFATILRIETYSLKAILPRLIIVALLINFSLVIAGAILDFANVMTNFFFIRLTENGNDIATALQNGLKLTEYYRTKDASSASGGFWKGVGLAFGFTSISISVFIYALMAVIFLIAAIFIFIALIVMMLIRALYLWVLLILAPAAWFFYIIPAFQNQWYKWWSNFFRWAFFAPIAMFFIYLSITTLTNIGKDRINTAGRNLGQDIKLESLQASARATTAGQKNIMSKNIVESVFQMFIGMGLLLGSLMVANSMSITGAGMATSLGKRMGTGMAVWAGRKAQTPTSRWAGKLGEAIDKSKLFQYAGLRQLSRPFQRYAESGRAYEKQLEERYKKQSPEYLASLHGKVDDPKKRAIESVLAGIGALDKVLKNPDDIKRAAERAFKGGNKNLARSIVKFDPTVAAQINKDMLGKIMGESIKSVNDVLRTLKPDDWVKMNDNSFASLAPELLKTAKGAHIGNLAAQGEFNKLKQIEEATKDVFEDQVDPTLLNYFESQAGQSLIKAKFKKRPPPKIPFSTA